MSERRSVDWSAATKSTVYWVQAVVAALGAAMWLLAQGPYATSDTNGGERAWVLVATAAAVLAGVAGSASLARSPSAWRRGLALGLAGSAVAVGVAAMCVAFVVLRWAS